MTAASLTSPVFPALPYAAENWFTANIPFSLDPEETKVDVFYEVSEDKPPVITIYAIEPHNREDTISDFVMNEMFDDTGEHYAMLLDMAIGDYSARRCALRNDDADRRYQAWKEEREQRAIVPVAVDVFDIKERK